MVSHSISERTHEIGVRVALGASQTDILRLVVGREMLLVLAGLVIGAVGSLAVMRLIAAWLFDVRATDPTTFVFFSALLGLVALAASYPCPRRGEVGPGGGAHARLAGFT